MEQLIKSRSDQEERGQCQAKNVYAMKKVAALDVYYSSLRKKRWSAAE